MNICTSFANIFFDQNIMPIKLHLTERAIGCMGCVWSWGTVCEGHTFSERSHVGKNKNREWERVWGSVTVKKSTKNKQPQKKRQRVWERTLSPTGEVSILMSTISHCSLAAGQIDRNTWLSKTSGNRKHRRHKQAETCCFSTGGPWASSPAPEHNATSRTQERKRRPNLLSLFLPLACFPS